MGQHPETRLKHLLLARFAMVRNSLNEALDHVTDERLDFAPREGMPTIQEILLEIAGTEEQIRRYILEGIRIPLKEVTGPWIGTDTVSGVRARLEAVRAETLSYLDSINDADLETMYCFPQDWSESLGLPEVPLREALISLAAHEAYHTGQLVSYLWAAGEDPMAW